MTISTVPVVEKKLVVEQMAQSLTNLEGMVGALLIQSTAFLAIIMVLAICGLLIGLTLAVKKRKSNGKT